MNEINRLIPLIPGLLKMIEMEDDVVQTTANQQMALISQTSGTIFSSYINKLIVLFLENEQENVLSKVLLVLHSTLEAEVS